MNKIRLHIIYFSVQIFFFLLVIGNSVALEQGKFKENYNRFDKANIYYEKKDYEEAIRGYESILDLGFKSGALYFNLANSYLKNEELGKAILNYERARRLKPRDGDILANYRYAKTLMKQQNPISNRFFIVRGLDRALGYITLKEAIFLETAIYLFVIFGIIALMFLRKIRVYLLPIIVIGVFAFLIELIPITNKIDDLKQGAIVIARITDASFEPLETSTAVFPLYEGMKVSILRVEREWSRIKRNDGKIGWVKSNVISLIGI